jgi:phosphohistidine phosphatase
VKIYLIRHAQAFPASSSVPDTSRYLSAEGRQTARAVGRTLRTEEIEFDAILTSPLVRAVQTAELIADAVDFLGVIEATSGLLPSAQARPAAELFAGKGEAVAAIGHEPLMSALGAVLLAREGFPPLRPGQVCLIENGEPKWSLNPEVMRIDLLHVGT